MWTSCSSSLASWEKMRSAWAPASSAPKMRSISSGSATRCVPVAMTNDSCRPWVCSHSSRSARNHPQHVGRRRGPGGVVHHHQQRRAGSGQEVLEARPCTARSPAGAPLRDLRPASTLAPSTPATRRRSTSTGVVPVPQGTSTARHHLPLSCSTLAPSLTRIPYSQDTLDDFRGAAWYSWAPPSGRIPAMKHFSYSISADVFAHYPGYVRGVVVAHDVTNGPSPAELVQLLRDAEESVRGEWLWSRWPTSRASSPGGKPTGCSGRSRPSFGRRSRLWPGGPFAATRFLRSTRWSTSGTSSRFAIWFRREATPSTCSAATSSCVSPPARGIRALRSRGDGAPAARRGGLRRRRHSLDPPLDLAAGKSHPHPSRDPGHRVQRRRTAPGHPGEIEAACDEVAELVRRFCGGQTRVDFLTATTPRISLAPY